MLLTSCFNSASCFADDFALARDLAAVAEASVLLTRSEQKRQKVSKEFIQKKNVSQQRFVRITRNGRLGMCSM